MFYSIGPIFLGSSSQAKTPELRTGYRPKIKFSTIGGSLIHKMKGEGELEKPLEPLFWKRK